MIFRWDRRLETGIALIDAQHRQFMEEANSFFIQYKFGYEANSFRKYLEFLQHFVQSHFPAEEAYQVKCTYPKYRVHQSTHQYLATKLKFVTVKMQECNYCKQEYDLFYEFMNEWIQKHVLQDDLDFCQYFRQSQEKPGNGQR